MMMKISKRMMSGFTCPPGMFLTKAERSSICKDIGVPENRVFLTVAELLEWRKNECDTTKETLGFVPTMGALHAGHLSLLQRCVSENPKSIASIFVNPGQFAPHEDFARYPRTIRTDLEQMFDKGVDCVFVPHQLEMYPGTQFGDVGEKVCATRVIPRGIDHVSEGAARPGFFAGVSTVCCKLFNLVRPNTVYLGQKDGLQVLVLRRMIRDLNMQLRIQPCDTLRETDGLAMSSRNIYLSNEQRTVAPKLYQSLCAMRQAYESGDRSYESLQRVGREILENEPLFKIEYLSICDSIESTELTTNAVQKLPETNIMISAAVKFSNCRILDNVLVGKQH